MNNGTCAPSNYQTYTRKVAVYANDEFSILGPNAYCPNTAVDFLSSIIGGSVTGYQWTAPTGWSASGHSTPYFHVSLPGSYTSGAVTLRLQNRCGWTNTPYVLNFSNNCSFKSNISIKSIPHIPPTLTDGVKNFLKIMICKICSELLHMTYKIEK
jgi:hypothetical protein